MPVTARMEEACASGLGPATTVGAIPPPKCSCYHKLMWACSSSVQVTILDIVCPSQHFSLGNYPIKMIYVADRISYKFQATNRTSTHSSYQTYQPGEPTHKTVPSSVHPQKTSAMCCLSLSSKLPSWSPNIKELRVFTVHISLDNY